MKKTISYIIYFLLGILFPLIGELHLLLDIRIILISIASAVLIFTQPFKDIKEVKWNNKTDKNSYWWILGLSFLSLVLPILEWAYLLEGAKSNLYLIIIGIILIATGLALRFWAIRVLGKFFKSSIRVSIEQEIIQSGPYKIVRHPSYLGAYLVIIGITILLGSWSSMLIGFVLMGFAYYLRIKVEENALRKHFGQEYEKYMRYSWSLIPGLW